MRRIFLNFIYSAFYQILLIALPLITTPYLSRIFAPDVFGEYSYCFTIASCVALFGILGINNYGNRLVAEKKDSKKEVSKAFFEIYIVQIFFSFISVVVYSIYAIWFCKYSKMAVILIVNVVSTLFDINWFFWGLEKFKLTVTRNIIIKISAVVAILAWVKQENDIYLYAFIMSLANLISHISIWPFIRGYISPIKVTIINCLKHIRPCLLLFIPILAQYLYKNIDRVMLGTMSSMEQVGYYSNADKIAVMPVGIITALGTVLLPHLSNVFANKGLEKAKSYIKISMKFSNFVSCGMMFGVAAISTELIPVFLGDKYYSCIPLLKYLSVLAFFIAWSNAISTQYLIPTHNDKIYVKGVCLGVLVNIVCNYLLIPLYGALGAVIGTIAAEATLMIYQNVKVKNELPINTYIKDSIPFLIVGFFMYGVVRLTSLIMVDTIFKLVLEICVGIIFYSLICFIIECYRTPDNVYRIKEFFDRRR